MADVPTLSAAVGPNQPNRPDDLRLIRQYLNAFIRAGYLGPRVELPESGGWDASVANALQQIEDFYFFGEADPDNKLETSDTLFQFLVHSDLNGRALGSTLTIETYNLASVMVPGGVDHVKRTTVKTTEIVGGKPHVKKTIKEEKVTGNIGVYLPSLLKALTWRRLNDTDMLMMALGTIRAESAAFKPINEGVSKYNTTPVGTPDRHLFDKYDFRADLGNDHLNDGTLYKGRGFVQLTGHDNYELIGKQINVDLLLDPDKANDPDVAAAVLAQFLKNKESAIRVALKTNSLAKARKLVNGGSHGLAEFQGAFAAGRKYLGIVIPKKAKQAIVNKTAKPKVGR